MFKGIPGIAPGIYFMLNMGFGSSGRFFNSGSIAHAPHKIINTATTVYSTFFTLKDGIFFLTLSIRSSVKRSVCFRSLTSCFTPVDNISIYMNEEAAWDEASDGRGMTIQSLYILTSIFFSDPW